MDGTRRGDGAGAPRTGQIESGYLWTGQRWVVAPGAGCSEPTRGAGTLRTRSTSTASAGGWAGRSVVVVPSPTGSRHVLVVALVALLLATAVFVTFAAVGLL